MGTYTISCSYGNKILIKYSIASQDDAELTPKGIEEAKKASAAFKYQIKAKFPLPDVYYSSPLRYSFHDSHVRNNYD